MAARSSHRPDGNKGFRRTQKKYVAKTEIASTEPVSAANDQISTVPFTTSLRESGEKSSSKFDHGDFGKTGFLVGDESTSASRVQEGRDGNWVSKKLGRFVNYLPQDEAVAVGLGVEDGGLDAVESQRVVDILNRELALLLKMNPKEFWKEVASDYSLHEFLDSYLQFRIRWYDFPHHGAKGIVAGVIVGEFELSRRVFMVFYRISANKDLGARASDSFSAKEHGALLQEKKLLDLPKLLDICAIYGRENEALTRLLVANALKAQPRLVENLTMVASHFLSIVLTMHQRVSSSLEVLVQGTGGDDHRNSRLYEDFLEVMDFVNDAISTLDAFADAYKPAAMYFSCPAEISNGNGELLTTLAMLHDSLVPSLLRGFALTSTARLDDMQKSRSCMLPSIGISIKMLAMRIVSLGWKLLDFCYLSDAVFECDLPLLNATKMFPAKVEDPVIRGDILVQTFQEINIGISYDVEGHQSSGTFLQNIEENHQILSRLNNLRIKGWVFMDDQQYQYLSLLAKPLSSKPREKYPELLRLPPGNNTQRDEDAAIIESKISQIKEIFPDYGKGFLSACLEVYNQNPEEVIQRILEGTLHQDLSNIKTSLEEIPRPTSKSSSIQDKGKGALVEPEIPYPKPDSNSGQREITGSSSSSTSSFGRFVRKSKTNSPDSVILDSRNAEVSKKSVILAANYEYEDEYDDSFDDLGLGLVESGFEETESLGDRVSSVPGRSGRVETESSSSAKHSDSRWNSQKKPQFYVKDGKNYSYKVSGSIAVSDVQQAALVSQAQKEIIHGLGRGGNLPLGAVKALMESNDQEHQSSDAAETGGRGNPNSRGWGRGRRGGGNNYRKDRAMKKHFGGLSGY